MRETMREPEIEPKAIIAMPAFAGTGVAERSISRFVYADLEANSRAPLSPANSRRARFLVVPTKRRTPAAVLSSPPRKR
jgi:hypothetical protein